MDKRKNIGNYAEKIASDYLKDKGYKIVEKNFRKPWGEIDIIAKDGSVFVFVEVKANSLEFGQKDFSPETRVDRKKIIKIVKTAQYYLDSGSDVEWRIDLVSIVFNKENKTAKITHFKNIGD